MGRGWRGLLGLVAVPLAALLLAAHGLAQDEVENEVPYPRRVDPAECVADPLPVDSLNSLLGLDAEGLQRPPYPRIEAPLGEVVDTATRVSIKEAAREVLACFNAGDIPRAAALMTPSGVARAYWGLSVDQAAREAARLRLDSPPQPRPEAGQNRLITVTDISGLPDGRIVAFVVMRDPLRFPTDLTTLLFFFIDREGRWLLDDWVDFVVVPATQEAASPGT